MSNPIFRNGPPAWVLEERRRQAVEQEATPSSEALCELKDNRDPAPNADPGNPRSRTSTSSTSTDEPVRKSAKRAATAS